MGWASGSCAYGGPEPGAGTPVHIIETKAEIVLVLAEGLEESIAAHRDELGANFVEAAALAERVENVVEELRWLRDLMGRLTGRQEQAARERRDRFGPTPS